MSLPRRQLPVHPRTWAPGSPRAVSIIVAMLGGWAVSQLAMWAFGIAAARQMLELHGSAIAAGEYWRFFTHQLFHAGPVHFLGTVLLFYFTGREVEPITGKWPFVSLCLAAGLLGGVVNWLAAPATPVLGFSAPAAAVVAAYATILPELSWSIALPGLSSLRFRAKWLVCAGIALATAALATGAAGATGPAGILAGSIAGWLWARWHGFGRPFAYQRRRSERRELEVRRSRMEPAEFIASEVDPVLEKISRSGIGSLTREERGLLDQARAKLATQPAHKP